MKHILMTPEEKKVAIDVNTDVCLFGAPRNPPNTGTSYTSGTDIYAHKARSGKAYFYTYTWSMWEGVMSSYNLITDDEAKQMLLRKSGKSGYDGLGHEEMELAEEYFPGIFDEDA
ncbi:MAG: hypothetical protein PHI12_08340 [Dehalococcoidales bacterium]|nr:hypothetical protein [Dehalococcoidales bacterium]